MQAPTDRQPSGPATKSIRQRFTAVLVGCVLMSSLWPLACGDGKEFNLFGLVSKPTIGKTKAAKNEEARVLLDDRNYDSAVAMVEPMIGSPKEDSNDARLLYAAGRLGQAKLDLWSLIASFLDSQTTTAKTTSTSKSGSSPGGIDNFLDTFTTSLLGTAEETAAKIQALSDAITVLRAAPDATAKPIVNTACLLGAILAVPSFSSAKNAVTATTSALEKIQASARGGGETCPDIALLDSALRNAQTAVSQFTLVLDVSRGCPFLNTSDTANQLNSIEKQLAKLVSGADKGCSGLPTCPASSPNCQSLFPTCVQKTLSNAGGIAGDGVISACELTRNCLVGSDCF